MKLLVDARIGWGHGIGRVIANTVPRVARLRPGWKIDVLVPPSDLLAAETAFVGASNLTIKRCAVRPFSVREQTALQAYGRGYDLTWFTNYWVPLAWRGRFVVTVHDMLHLLPEYTPGSRIRRALAKRTFAKVRRDARAVMFDSRYTQDAFGRIVGLPRQGRTVPLGGDHLEYGTLKPLGDRARRLIVVAAAKQHKNFALLFDAWRKARVADHWVLTVISPGAMLRTSIDLSDAAETDDDAANRIDIRRGVSNAELASLYADSAILLMPSLYEGFGLPLLEGMLAGALCISSSAGSMVEIAEGAFVQFVNGTDLPGWIAAIEQACATIDRGDLDLDALLRHNALQASRFRWDRTATDVIAVLESTMMS